MDVKDVGVHTHCIGPDPPSSDKRGAMYSKGHMDTLHTLFPIWSGMPGSVFTDFKHNKLQTVTLSCLQL